jgi:hypothetical protein
MEKDFIYFLEQLLPEKITNMYYDEGEQLYKIEVVPHYWPYMEINPTYSTKTGILGCRNTVSCELENGTHYTIFYLPIQTHSNPLINQLFHRLHTIFKNNYNNFFLYKEDAIHNIYKISNN